MKKEEFKDYTANFNGESVAVECSFATCTDVTFISCESDSVHFTLSLSGNVVDDENDLFAVTTAANVLLSMPKLPLKDNALRTLPTFANALPKQWNEAEKDAYKNVIKTFFIGKEIPFKRVSVSVKTLTNGAATSYKLDLGDEPVLVTTRTIVFPAGENEQTALKRLANQVARAIEGEEGE